MKKFNENIQNEFKEIGDTNTNNLKIDESIDTHEEDSYKQFKDEEEKDEYINPSMRKFRTVIGGICIVMFIFFMFQGVSNQDFRKNLTSGAIENVNAGDILSKNNLKLDAKDASIDVLNGFGNLEISIWNFAEKEDNDYVQVFIDGVAQGAPFSIRHKPVKISVPDKGVIQVQGVRDGSNNGITYAVHFNKTGETYLNTVPLNSMNTYTIISK